MNRCQHCDRRLGLGTVSMGLFRRLRFCSANCKRVYRASWVSGLSAQPCDA